MEWSVCIHTLLADGNGECLLEGLVTNFFVVTTDSDNNTPLVLTAPTDQCLPGLVRAAVLEACAAEGFAVKVGSS